MADLTFVIDVKVLQGSPKADEIGRMLDGAVFCGVKRDMFLGVVLGNFEFAITRVQCMPDGSVILPNIG
jgi:hypothetical protein